MPRGHCVHSVTGELTNPGEVSDARLTDGRLP
jgi:hypothetical protein